MSLFLVIVSLLAAAIICGVEGVDSIVVIALAVLAVILAFLAERGVVGGRAVP